VSSPQRKEIANAWRSPDYRIWPRHRRGDGEARSQARLRGMRELPEERGACRSGRGRDPRGRRQGDRGAGGPAIEDEVIKLFERVDLELGPVTALVNNAGITGRAGRLDSFDAGAIRRVLEVNVAGVIFC